MLSTRSFVVFQFAAAISQPSVGRDAVPSIAVLYPNGTADVDRAFSHVLSHFERAFDHELYGQTMDAFEVGLAKYNQSAVLGGHALGTVVPHCDRGVVPISAANVRGVAAFPGGTVGSIFGFDLGKRLFELSEHARGPASAGLVAPVALSNQALSTGMGLVQAAVAALVHVVPPLVSPPAWNNQPLSCAPMASGHNCFGSVLYPITMADSMMAGSAPVCLHTCVMPLVMCPGFWVSDLLDSCSSVSVPPLCSQAAFSNVKRAPPQIASFDEANPFPAGCPPAVGSRVRDEDLALYDAEAFPESPIEKEAAAFAPSPGIAF